MFRFVSFAVMDFRTELQAKILSRNFDFETEAFNLFHYQLENNDLYREYVMHLGINVSSITNLFQIPFLPIEFFKTHKIVSGSFNHDAVVYSSSGTTGSTTSKHFVFDETFYLKNAQLTFEEQYGSLSDFVVLGLLPSYLERSGSSLIAMVDFFIKRAKNDLSGFFLNEYEELVARIDKASRIGKKVLLLGVTFGLLDFTEKHTFVLPKGSVVMETGGMKGRRKEMTRDEIHEVLKGRLSASSVHSEYGMTELLSQCYSKGEGVFVESPTMRIYLRELTDPLNVSKEMRSGGINVIDLCNIDSCSFISTQDQGVVRGAEFEVLGRIDNSDVRGCNLLVV